MAEIENSDLEQSLRDIAELINKICVILLLMLIWMVAISLGILIIVI